LSFDFYKPSDGIGTGSLRVFLSNGSATDSGARLVEMALFENPVSAGSYNGTSFTTFPDGINYLPLDVKHHVEVMGIVSDAATPLGSKSYFGQTESVDDNTYDLWIDGVKVADNYMFRNGFPAPAISTFGFSGVNSLATTTAYLDNIFLRTDLPGAAAAGDHNLDGKVDSADYVLWRKDPNSHGGDPDGYDAWRANFGVGAGSGSGLGGSAVPEPSLAVLLVTAICTVAGGTHRRRTWK
jgi:hypothetical protein